MRKPKSSIVLPQKKNFVNSVRKQYGNLDSHPFTFFYKGHNAFWVPKSPAIDFFTKKKPTRKPCYLARKFFRTKLITMARIHICLEFLLLVQNNLSYSLDTLYSFFGYVLKLYTSDQSPVTSFADLVVNTIYTVKVPRTNSILKEIAKA